MASRAFSTHYTMPFKKKASEGMNITYFYKTSHYARCELMSKWRRSIPPEILISLDEMLRLVKMAHRAVKLGNLVPSLEFHTLACKLELMAT